MLDTISRLVLDGIGGFALPYLAGRVVTGVFFVFGATTNLRMPNAAPPSWRHCGTATSRLFR